jgi:hypothetical protein
MQVRDMSYLLSKMDPDQELYFTAFMVKNGKAIRQILGSTIDMGFIDVTSEELPEWSEKGKCCLISLPEDFLQQIILAHNEE